MLKGKFNHCLDNIRNGNNNGLLDIYNEYFNKMTLTALMKVNEIEDAKDIASNFLLYLLENAKSIPYIEYPNAWVYQSIRNLSVSFIRKDSRTIKIEDCNENIFSTDYDFDLYNLLTDGINALQDNEKEIFIKHYIYGFKYQGISEMLGMPIGTIKRQIFEIKEKLHNLKKYL